MGKYDINPIDLVIQDDVVEIGEYACANNPYLRSCEIAASCNVIGAHAFENSGELVSGTKIVILAENPTIDPTAFASEYINEIYVQWQQNEVDGEPWGATNAVVYYANSDGTDE